MNQYDPNIAPVASEWLELDDDERIELIMNFHERADTSLSSIQAHAIIHVIVENQIALGKSEVINTVKKLIRQGLDRHEALHAIGAIVAEDTFDLIRGDGPKEYDHERYNLRLKNLTAQNWRSGDY